MAIISFFMITCHCYAQRSDFATHDFKKADDIALGTTNVGLEDLPRLSYHLTSQLSTDAEKFRAIYRWVCANVANDYGLYERNMRKRRRFQNDTLKLNTWNRKFRTISFEKLLKNKRTICTGYAYLIHELSRLSNINCEIVHGFARTSTTDVSQLDVPNHSWNAVELNGKWYLCDPTWASGIPNSSTYQFQFDYNDGFFLPNPDLFALNHYPLDRKWLLFDTSAFSFNTFLNAPVLYGGTFKKLTMYDQPREMHFDLLTHESVFFKVQLHEPILKGAVKLMIDNGTTTRKISPELITIEDHQLSLEYSFENAGFYDVHLYIGEDIVATHTVKVSLTRN